MSTISKLVQLIEVIDAKASYTSESEQQYTLRPLAVNPSLVAHIRPEETYKEYLNEGRLPEGLDRNAEFTRIIIAAGSGLVNVVVVGNIEQITNKINAAYVTSESSETKKKRLLRG